jgi:hypothetical protein
LKRTKNFGKSALALSAKTEAKGSKVFSGFISKKKSFPAFLAG